MSNHYDCSTYNAILIKRLYRKLRRMIQLEADFLDTMKNQRYFFHQPKTFLTSKSNEIVSLAYDKK